MRMTTSLNGEHHVTIPRHSSLRVATRRAILNDVGEHQDIQREKLVESLFGK
jgi:hypothetical protein